MDTRPRMIAAALLLVVGLTACGSGGTTTLENPESAPTSAGPTSTPSGSASPAPTSTPVTAEPGDDPAVVDLQPARISFDEYGMAVRNAAGDTLQYLPFDLTGKQAVAALTTVLGASPTRIRGPQDEQPKDEWLSDSGLGGYDFGGLAVFPAANPSANRRYVVRVTVTEVNGVELDASGVGAGVQIGAPTSSVVSEAGYGWPDGGTNYLFGNPNGGIWYYSDATGTTVVGYHIPLGT
jgi:hypothetical protein